MKFKKGDKVVLIDVDDFLHSVNTELYGVYIVDSYAKTDNKSYDIMEILILEGINCAFSADRFITLDKYRKQKMKKILSKYDHKGNTGIV